MRKKALYDMKYIRENYHRIDLKVPFDDYEKWKAAAEAEGLPVATWIKDKCNKAIPEYAPHKIAFHLSYIKQGNEIFFDAKTANRYPTYAEILNLPTGQYEADPFRTKGTLYRPQNGGFVVTWHNTESDNNKCLVFDKYGNEMK